MGQEFLWNSFCPLFPPTGRGVYGMTPDVLSCRSQGQDSSLPWACIAYIKHFLCTQVLCLPATDLFFCFSPLCLCCFRFHLGSYTIQSIVAGSTHLFSTKAHLSEVGCIKCYWGGWVSLCPQAAQFKSDGGFSCQILSLLSVCLHQC